MKVRVEMINGENFEYINDDARTLEKMVQTLMVSRYVIDKETDKVYFTNYAVSLALLDQTDDK